MNASIRSGDFHPHFVCINTGSIVYRLPVTTITIVHLVLEQTLKSLMENDDAIDVRVDVPVCQCITWITTIAVLSFKDFL